MASLIWNILCLPFRLIGGVVELVGRAVGGVLGFTLMVLGVALAAGLWFAPGGILFLLGLALMIRSVG
jgi:hypothetical protein